MSKWYIQLLRLLMPVITPEIKQALDNFIATLRQKASATPNEFDDMFVDFLEGLFGGKP